MTVAQHLKSYIRKMNAWLYYSSQMGLRYHRGKVAILMYHRVLSEADLQNRFVQPGMYVLDHVFEKQMKFLKDNFEIVSFGHLLKLWDDHVYDINKRYCVITFDDGWLDNYQNAFPILKQYKISATIFLPTDFIGTNQWYWPERISYLLHHVGSMYMSAGKRHTFHSVLHRHPLLSDIIMSMTNAVDIAKRYDIMNTAIELLKESSSEEIDELLDEIISVLELPIPDDRIFLNWDEVAQMSQQGISFGSHSCSHRILTKLPLRETIREIDLSKQMLHDKKINDLPIFCYPNGNHNSELQDLVRDCGYKAAVTTDSGLERTFPPNFYSLKRIPVHNDITSTTPLFSFHISGIYSGR